MSTTIHTTSTGTEVYLEGPAVILDNPASPDDMRNTEAGRVIDGGYQPALFAAWALTPETLRAIADLVEEATA